MSDITFDLGTGTVTGDVTFDLLTGVTGPGVPSGGEVGQVLAKASGDDYDTAWQDNNNIVVDTVAIAFAADAVDGTGNAFRQIRPKAGAAASGDIPAGWESAGDVLTEAVAASLVTSAFAGATTVFVPETGRTYDVSSSGSELTWTVRPVASVVVVTLVPTIVLVHGTTTVPIDPELIGYDGLGIIADATNVKVALDWLEGALDRWVFVSAVADVNVNTADFTTGTYAYGALDFTGGADCHVWLRNQTDPDEDGFWRVVSAGTGTKINHPDIFDPPGQGFRVTVKEDGGADDGRTWVFLSDDPEDRQRANGTTDPLQTGRFVEVPGTGSGSGPSLSDATPAALGSAAAGVSADASRADHVHAMPDAADVGAAPGYLEVRRTTDLARNSSTTLTDDPVLTLDAAANTVYEFTAFCIMSCASDSIDGKLGVSLPSGATIQSITVDGTSTSTTGSAGAGRDYYLNSTSDEADFGLTATRMGIAMRGVISISSTSGAVAVKWAQRSSNATDVTMHTGSFLRLIPLANNP